MTEYKDYIGVILAGAGAIFLIGFVVLTFAEVMRLKKKDWLDEKVVWKYPIITNIVNILVVPIVFIVIFYISAIVLIIVLTIKDKKIIAENVLDAAFYIVVILMTFCGYFVAFSVVRLITSNVMAKSSNLTWKYIMGQSFFPTILLVVVSFLFVATFYM